MVVIIFSRLAVVGLLFKAFLCLPCHPLLWRRFFSHEQTILYYESEEQGWLPSVLHCSLRDSWLWFIPVWIAQLGNKFIFYFFITISVYHWI